eukprot:GHVN01002601.1.p1 GENE.GHVN01002601.1~~GHVN01002601.1.p1  ORF type:complete len:555 (+),score=58.96 GHVN01002601.1:77-1666(+)
MGRMAAAACKEASLIAVVECELKIRVLLCFEELEKTPGDIFADRLCFLLCRLKARVDVLQNVFGCVFQGVCILENMFYALLSSLIICNSEMGERLETAFMACIREERRLPSQKRINEIAFFIKKADKKAFERIIVKPFFSSLKEVYFEPTKNVRLFMEEIRGVFNREKQLASCFLSTNKHKKYLKRLRMELFGRNSEYFFEGLDQFKDDKEAFRFICYSARKTKTAASFEKSLAGLIKRQVSAALLHPKAALLLAALEKTLGETLSYVGGPSLIAVQRSAFSEEINKEKKMFSEKLALHWDGHACMESADFILGLLRYLQKKDSFHQIHLRLFEDRMMLRGAFPEALEPERYLVERLKKECGPQYTAAFEDRLEDMQRAIKDECKVFQGSFFFPLVLSSAVWARKSENSSILIEEQKIFELSYKKTHPRRNISWDNRKGHVIVEVDFGDRKIDWAMSPFQGAMLCLFSDGAIRSGDEVAKMMHADAPEVERELALFVKKGLLEYKGKLFIFCYQDTADPMLFAWKEGNT